MWAHQNSNDIFFRINILRKIDLVFLGSEDLGVASGKAKDEIKGDRLRINITTSGNLNVLYEVETLAHEIIIHGIQFSKDFCDDKTLNNSNVHKTIRDAAKKHEGGTNYMHHWQERYYDKKLIKYGLPILKEVNKNMGLNKTDTQLREMLYNFLNG